MTTAQMTTIQCRASRLERKWPKQKPAASRFGLGKTTIIGESSVLPPGQAQTESVL